MMINQTRLFIIFCSSCPKTFISFGLMLSFPRSSSKLYTVDYCFFYHYLQKQTIDIKKTWISLDIFKNPKFRSTLVQAKVSIKSEKITPFGGIFLVREHFSRFVGPVINKVLGLRCTSFGYQSARLWVLCYIFRSIPVHIMTTN